MSCHIIIDAKKQGHLVVFIQYTIDHAHNCQ